MDNDEIETGTANATTLGPPPINLPLEILDLIGAQVDDTSLFDLSLVNREFLGLSRVRIFRSAHFEGKKGKKRFQRFLDLLESPQSTFAPSLENLTFVLFNGNPGNAPRVRSHASNLGRKLTNTKSIKINMIVWDSLNPGPDFLSFLSAIPAHEIRINSCGFFREKASQGLANYWRMLSDMSQAGCRIHLSDHNYSEALTTRDLDSLSKVFTRPLHISSLDTAVIAAMQPVWDSEAFDYTTGIVSIDRLYLTEWMVKTIERRLPFICRFIKLIGPNLKELLIEPGEAFFGRFGDHLDLSTTINLTQIHFGPIWSPKVDCSILLEELRKILLRVPTSKVQLLALWFRAFVQDEEGTQRVIMKNIEQFPWEHVTSIGALPKLARIKVTFHILYLGGQSEYKSVVEATRRLEARILGGLGAKASTVSLELAIINGWAHFPPDSFWNHV